MERYIYDTDQKALEINLNDKIYGTFAEIGAGQEVARHFFKVGAAAGTIAKTMSAYDKTYSDSIYGEEASGRYVCESRLYKMLDHEYALMEERLQNEKPDTRFFVFADTVAAINYARTIKGNGWMGVRFQIDPNGEPNEVIIHAKMKDNDNQLQQTAVGILGVNLLFACYFHTDCPEFFIQCLHDNLKGRMEIDMIRTKGPDLKSMDDRLLSLMLVQYGLTEVSMFDETGRSLHPSEFLYRKSVMVVRGNYKPPTLVSMDVFDSSFKQFKDEIEVIPEKASILAELTIQRLLDEDGKIDYKDFLERARLLNACGKKLIISSCINHQNLINYLSDYKIAKLGLVIGAQELLQIINEKYYQNLDGRLLVAFGELFTRNIKIYVYPVLQEDGQSLMKAKNLPVPKGINFLYKYLLESEHVVEITEFMKSNLQIFPYMVLEKIAKGDDSFMEMLPENIGPLIKEEKMLDYNTYKEIADSKAQA